MSTLSFRSELKQMIWHRAFGEEKEHLRWYRALEEFMTEFKRSAPAIRRKTLADLRKGLQERLRREPDDKKVFKLVTAYGGLSHIVDTKIYSFSSSIEDLELYLKSGFSIGPRIH